MTEYKIETVERCAHLFLPGIGYVDLTDNKIQMEIPEPIATRLKKYKNFTMTEIKPEDPKPAKKVKQSKPKTKKATKKD